jgi:hypothetical protein
MAGNSHYQELTPLPLIDPFMTPLQWDIVAEALRDWLVTHSSGVEIGFRV